MKIQKESNGNILTVTLEGRLDTTTAPELEAELKAPLEYVTELILDFTQIEYISSAGVRVIIMAQKAMGQRGKLVVRNANQSVRDVFEITGLTSYFAIE